MTADETSPPRAAFDTAAAAALLRRLRREKLPGRVLLVAVLATIAVVAFADRVPHDMPDLALMIAMMVAVPAVVVAIIVLVGMAREWRADTLDIGAGDAPARARCRARLAASIAAAQWKRLTWFLVAAGLLAWEGIVLYGDGRRGASPRSIGEMLVAASVVCETVFRRVGLPRAVRERAALDEGNPS